MKKERRFLTTDIELRMDDGENKSPKIVGYAAVFNSMSEDMGFREIIKPGAFRNAMSDDVRALWNHDSNYVLGRNKSGTLKLKEDATGLRVEIDPPDTTWANDLIKSMKRGDVDQMSFGFSVNPGGERSYEIDGQNIRELLDLSLFDVSPVTYPAYTQTSVSARSIFNEAGINFEALSSVITRSNNGMELTDSDKDLIKSSIEVLHNLAGEVQENPSANKQETQERSIAENIDLLKKKLKLRELDI